MKLFSKENDIVKRILNLILVIWLVITIVLAYTSVVDLLFDYSLENYDDYKILYCTEDKKEECLDHYEYEKINNKVSKTNQIKDLINSGGNFLVVGTFILIFNKKEKVKTKSKNVK